MQIQKNIPLKNYTTFKIGGPAKYFCVVENENDLIGAVVFAKKEKLPFFILGGGSNLLVSDNGFNGVVIKIENRKLKIVNSTPISKGVGASTGSVGAFKIICGAGLPLSMLIAKTSELGATGMEWAAGIPGATVGGAIRGNAGAFETEMKDITKTVTVLEIQNSKVKSQNHNSQFKIKNKDCQFGYRSSIFKKNPNLIVLSAELELEKEKSFGAARDRVKEILGYRQGKHPRFPSAGSIFKNFKDVRAKDLIEKAGLKGKKIGGAQISDQHANFIVNLGNATAKDVLDLIALAKKEVKQKSGLDLEEEIQYLS